MGESSCLAWLPVATHLFCELVAAAAAKNSLPLLHLPIPSQNAAHARLYRASVHFYHVGLRGHNLQRERTNERTSEHTGAREGSGGAAGV